MSILENATAHYKAQLSGILQSIEVPEWETTIYFKGITSLADEQKVLKLHTEGKLAEALVESIISKACDADGKKLFKGADRVTLMHEVDPEVLMRLASHINKGVDEDELGN
mgnify:CR=1 FL=1|jgi:hypothetical protein|tara:strand:+ start:454 stop:786 length:333 start_codon:yes stop_codon:yes gene_type:complete